LAGCQALIMPSKYESLSMVLLEAWAVMKPVVVNAECDVLVGQCRRSNGGLWYADFEEFTVELNTLMRSSLSTELGKSGYNYVKSEYSWPSIERKYLRLFSDTTNPLLPAVAQLTGDPSKHRMPSLNTVEKQ
jgi:glycosyltransferase involved in cell wall biosynthesis